MSLSQKNIRLIYALLIGSLVSMIVLSLNTSISGDEDIHLKYGDRIINFFTSFGEDKSYMDKVRGPDYAYNFTFDAVIELFIRLTGYDDPHQLRHIFNGGIGWLIALFSAFLAKRYFGWPAAIMAFIFLLISPRFLGHSFNNPKDIPFAFGYILGLYSIFRFCDALPKPTWKQAIEVGLAIGLCLNFRIGGLLLIPYFGLFVMFRILSRRGMKAFNTKYLQEYGHIFLKGLGACIIAYILMVIFWPFALEAPLSNPLKSLEIMSDFAIGIRQLFEGSNVTSTALPSNYIYKWMFMTIPMVVLVGLVILPFTFFRHRTKKRGFVLACLGFAVVFPIVYAIMGDSNVYGAWRHFIFVYPPLVILSATGYRYLNKSLEQINPNLQYATFGVIGLLCIHPVWHIVKNHPVEYVYFNELSGGIDNAYGNYEMDYYMHSIQPAIAWMEQEGIINDTDEIKIVSNHMYSVQYYTRNRENVKAGYTRYYERLNTEWDYGVYVNTYIDRAELINNQFPPSGTIHTIDVNGKPMCAIVKRPSKASNGYSSDLKENNPQQAKNKLRAYYNVDQNNFEANINLALIYNKTGQRDSLSFFLSEAKRVNPQRFDLYVKQ